MTNKINVIQTSLVFMALLALLVASECLGFFYRPAAAVSILSEYAAFNDSAPPHTQVWKVVPELTPDGAATLQFFPEAAAETAAVCELYLSPFDSAKDISWKGIGKSGEKRSDTGLLLVPGFPAPCDVLPVGERDEGRVYQEKSEAGGSVFTRRYLVSSAAFCVAEAKARGWIREEAPGISGLIMVTVTDEKGRLAVRQLWPADGSWWLYEETPLRRSWLIH
jgi:hypothetical protein